MRKYLILLSLAFSAAIACTPEDNPAITPDEQPTQTVYTAKDGVEYLYDGATIPEMHLQLSTDEWNRLLKAYDKNPDTKQQVVCKVRFNKDGEISEIDSATVRLKGNTSRRRPEGKHGQMHTKDNTDWHHAHFQVNFRKLKKDSAHEIHGARKVILKWFKDDPCYVRELYCYDLFRRAGVWTGAHAAYCKLYIHIGNDSKEAYFGVYCMIEPIDDEFLKARKEELNGYRKGFLWKCRYGCSLANVNDEFGPDINDGKEYRYELKTETDDFELAKKQLKDFIGKLNSLDDEAFKSWIAQVCDVELLLKTYAVNVCVGMWDDYWNNTNNFYIYFNKKNETDYKFYFIPYDYDNSLGTSSKCGQIEDSGRHNPYEWGSKSNPLIYRILQIPEYKKIYRDELLRLVDPMKPYFGYKASIERIRAWQSSIIDMVANDTGEDMTVRDQPASWGNHNEYRLLERGANNFFEVKAASVYKYCK